MYNCTRDNLCIFPENYYLFLLFQAISSSKWPKMASNMQARTKDSFIYKGSMPEPTLLDQTAKSINFRETSHNKYKRWSLVKLHDFYVYGIVHGNFPHHFAVVLWKVWKVFYCCRSLLNQAVKRFFGIALCKLLSWQPTKKVQVSHRH